MPIINHKTAVDLFMAKAKDMQSKGLLAKPPDATGGFLCVPAPQSAWRCAIPPATLDEQSAIAAVLADMDAEIPALEDKLTKVRAMKQGMMRVLLTGEIRLI